MSVDGQCPAVMEQEAAAAGRAAAAAVPKLSRKRMTEEEAQLILGIETPVKEALSEAAIEDRFSVMLKMNEPSEACPGSPYLQTKVSAARQVLLEKAGVKKEDIPKKDDIPTE